MGRHRRFTKPKRERVEDDSTQKGYPEREPTRKENVNFEEYYKNQNIVPEDEWECFMETLRKPLPATFRITGSRSHARDLLEVIKSDLFGSLVKIKNSNDEFEEPKCFDWYPDGLAWQINFNRTLIRSNPELKKLHNFLIAETESGNISRQEAVSMLPPLLLDIEPHHKVLDMCAAPGSKTAQMIEMLHADESNVIPDGMVIANDNDNRRCYLMTHQVKRLQSSCVMIINHDATCLPNFNTPLGPVKFDRILADVPCSGDGTLRKNIDIWRTWTPSSAFSLYPTQVRVMRRGVELLEIGGRIVYSTCSFNPVENEAVVSTLLHQSEGALELVDISDRLPGLKQTRGIRTWRVMDKKGNWYDSLTDVPEKFRRNNLRRGMFAPSPEVADKQHLERCLRILPHHQDTGGFFVAVFTKLQHMPWQSLKSQGTQQTTKESKLEPEQENEEELKLETDGLVGEPDGEIEAEDGEEEEKDEIKSEGAVGDVKEGNTEENVTNTNDADGRKRRQEMAPGPSSKKRKVQGFKEDPFIFLPEDNEYIKAIKEFYSLSDEFPLSQILTRRQEGKPRNLYLACKALSELLTHNQDRIKIINLGVRVFARSESPLLTCDFRFVQEGAALVTSFGSARQVTLRTRGDLITLLSIDSPFVTHFSLETQKQIDKLSVGGMLFMYEPDGSPKSPTCKIVICGWKGKVSCRAYLAKHERAHFLTLCHE